MLGGDAVVMLSSDVRDLNAGVPVRQVLTSAIGFSARTLAILVVIGMPAYSSAGGQVGDPAHTVASNKWTLSFVGGRYFRANASSGIADWLRQNDFAATRPVCREVGGFFAGTHTVCDGATDYPKVSRDGILGGAIGLRRRLSERFSIEGIVASEPFGQVEGRCISSPGFQCRGDTSYVMSFNGFAASTIGVITIKRL